MRMTLALVLTRLAITSTRAESPTLPPCNDSGWVLDATLDHDVGLPATPTVLLPARWQDRDSSAPDLSPATITVEVRDDLDQVIAGSVGVGLDRYPSSTYLAFRDRLWWRPATPLAPGTYRASVRAIAPAGGAELCPSYQDFEASHGFDVAATPAAAPTLSVDALAGLVYAPDLHYDRSCGAGSAACPNVAGACCRFLWPDTTSTFEASARLGELGDGGARYHVLEIDLDALGGYEETDHRLIYPPGAPTWSDRQQYYPAPYQRPFDRNLCVSARLVRLHDLTIVASATDCALTLEAPDPGPPPTPVCDPEGCAEVVVPPPPDGAVEVVERDEADADARPDPDPTTQTRDGGGCTTGSARDPSGALGLTAALVVLALTRRGRRAPRHRRA